MALLTAFEAGAILCWTIFARCGLFSQKGSMALLCSKGFQPGSHHQRSRTIFGRVATGYFMYTAVLRLLFLCFSVRWVVVGC